MPEAPAERRSAGDLAIVLHSHMPYVEGFGTYPFGEEWLFDAVIRSYLPLLDVARDLTLTVTPVLADQLEDAGVRERLRRFLVEWRIGAAEADAPEVAARVPARLRSGAGALPPGARAARRGRRRPAAALPARPSARGGSRSRPPRRPTRCCRCWRPAQGLRLQIDAGIRSHRRRFGWDGGFWLPECAYEPGLEWRAGRARRAAGSASTRAPTTPPLEALAPVATEAGPVALPIDWEAVSWLWSLDGYPSDPAHAQFAGKSLRGIRIWKVGGGAYDPEAAAAAARRQARGVPRRGRRAPARASRAERGRRGLLVFAIDTELLGHWWSEGAIWLEEVIAGAEAAGVRLLTVPQALAEHEPRRGAAAALDLGRGQGPADLGLAGGRRHRLGRAAARAAPAPGARRRACREAAATRAARELLAVQASDWAFLDGRGEAGDYAFQRATEHAEAALEAIESPAGTDPRMRSLAPDLSLAPLLAP